MVKNWLGLMLKRFCYEIVDPSITLKDVGFPFEANLIAVITAPFGSGPLSLNLFLIRQISWCETSGGLLQTRENVHEKDTMHKVKEEQIHVHVHSCTERKIPDCVMFTQTLSAPPRFPQI